MSCSFGSYQTVDFFLYALQEGRAVVERLGHVACARCLLILRGCVPYFRQECHDGVCQIESCGHWVHTFYFPFKIRCSCRFIDWIGLADSLPAGAEGFPVTI